ncbi:MAG: hypothetical protein IPL61_10405 [Myxococcales bacterium]|nr:hypothetical protein [Myxococcales bacterium]
MGASALVALVVMCAMTSSADAQRRRRGRSKPAKPRPAPTAPAPAPTPAPKPAGGGEVEPAGAPAPAPAGEDAGKGKPKVFDFTGLDINGRLRTPQLLYFLDRASEELERASLERRSFIPEMVNSIDESKL